MSNNNLISNRPMTSCMKIDGSMDLHNLTSLHDDSCELTFREKQSGGPGIYSLNQYRECECGVPKVIETASALIQRFSLETVLEFLNVLSMKILN